MGPQSGKTGVLIRRGGDETLELCTHAQRKGHVRTVRRQLSAGQEERSHQKPTPLAPSPRASRFTRKSISLFKPTSLQCFVMAVLED